MTPEPAQEGWVGWGSVAADTPSTDGNAHDSVLGEIRFFTLF